MRHPIRLKGAVAVATCSLLPATTALAQMALSTTPGVISYLEGDVTVAAERMASPRPGRPVPLLPEQPVATGDGRAEILLNPCVVLHLDQHSTVRMIANRLPDTRIELVTGSAIVRADGILRDTNVAVAVRGVVVPLTNRGVYGFDAEPPRLKVFSGKAAGPSEGAPPRKVQAGRLVDLASAAPPVRFDADRQANALGRWSLARAVALLRESGFDEQAERESERRERAWKQAEAGGRLAPGSLPPPSNGATQGRLKACAGASVR